VNTPILRLERVGKRLGKRLVLDDLSFSFDGPGVLVVRGANGAGKSTLLHVACGILQADTGDVRIAGASLARDRARALGAIGFVPESPELPADLTPRELAALGASLKRCAIAGASAADVERRVDELGMAHFVDSPIASLSLGQRRRALIFAALVGDPPLLLLDEPTNGLDAAGVAWLADLLAQRAARGQSSVVATHDAPFAARVATQSCTVEAAKLVA
jgi:ABC-type multidrug transport system ATPase subunit